MRFWRFGNSPSLFFNTLLLLVGLFLALGHWQGSHMDHTPPERPVLALFDFSFMAMDPQGVHLDARIVQAERYQDRDWLQGVTLRRWQEGRVESVMAPQVVHEDEFLFPKGLDYERQGGMAFFSESGRYDAKQQTFHGAGEFRLERTGVSLSGQNLTLERASGEGASGKIMGEKISLVIKGEG